MLKKSFKRMIIVAIFEKNSYDWFKDLEIDRRNELANFPQNYVCNALARRIASRLLAPRAVPENQCFYTPCPIQYQNYICIKSVIYCTYFYTQR